MAEHIIDKWAILQVDALMRQVSAAYHLDRRIDQQRAVVAVKLALDERIRDLQIDVEAVTMHLPAITVNGED